MAIKSLQAREIVREAKRLGITMQRGNYDKCLKGILIESGYISDRYKHSDQRINEAEAGFESISIQIVATNENRVWMGTMSANINGRYYKMGQRVAKLAGL